MFSAANLGIFFSAAGTCLTVLDPRQVDFNSIGSESHQIKNDHRYAMICSCRMYAHILKHGYVVYRSPETLENKTCSIETT